MYAQTTLIGFVGKDPEVRSMPNGKPVANFSLATTERWTDKQSGEKREQTEWHQLAAFGPTAKVVKDYVKTGTFLHIVGRPRTDKVEGRDGETKYFHKILVDRLTLLPYTKAPGGRQQESDGDDADTSADSGQTETAAGAEGFDDDIPF